MTVKGVNLKSESFFSIFCGVLELGRKNLKGGGRIPPSGPDRVIEHGQLLCCVQKARVFREYWSQLE